MRRYLGKAEFPRVLLHDMPGYSFRYAITQTLVGSVDRHFHPLGHRNGSNVPAFADEINYGPMFLALLQMREVQISQFAAAIPQPSNTARIARPAFLRACSWRLPEAAGFLGREPVPEPHAHLLGTFHTSDPGSEFRAEQASVCGLVGQPSYCSKSAIYRSRCELPTLEENAVAGDHNLVERQSRLGRSPPCRCVKDLAVMGASPLSHQVRQDDLLVLQL